jgi:hypothetical protein
MTAVIVVVPLEQKWARKMSSLQVPLDKAERGAVPRKFPLEKGGQRVVVVRRRSNEAES